jgi:hypothetical protein
MSDTVTLALAACVVVVVILLLSCRGVKLDRSNTASVNQSAKPPARSPSSCVMEQPDTTSRVGSGVANREFNNRYNDLSNLQGYDDYNAVSQYMSVEPEVYDSHARYSDDMGRSTSGASMLPVRDDRQDINPRVGVRLTNYSAVYAGPGSRQEHSEIPDQMGKPSNYCF